MRDRTAIKKAIFLVLVLVAAASLVSCGYFGGVKERLDEVQRDGETSPSPQPGVSTAPVSMPAPPPPSPEVVASLATALSGLPPASGDSDLEQMRSLIGPPDAFALTLEPRDGAAPVQREEWYYYEIGTVFEFADGKLVANLPLDENQGLLVVPLRYDPADFQLGTTWQEVARTLDHPGELQSYELEEGYELQVTYYVGAQLLLAFDDDGLLFYMEALPLETG
ncbi:MAG: hypothetical protein V3S82_03730, partial [Dehalococcoidia bacterium]